MHKLSIIAAAALLIGSSAISFAAGPKPGASGSAPGTQMNSTTTPENRGSARGASELSPGDRMNDARSNTTGSAKTKGASELSPGDKMNDKRGK
jgi:hypothetical protein